MKSDDVAEKIIRLDWEHVKGKDRESDQFFGMVKFGDFELKRFLISKGDYVGDRCAPCTSSAKRMRDEIAKILRQEYGE
jgi:hypothetical protein